MRLTLNGVTTTTSTKEEQAKSFFPTKSYVRANAVLKIEEMVVEKNYPIIKVEGGVQLSVRYIDSTYIGKAYKVANGLAVLESDKITVFKRGGTFVDLIKDLSHEIATNYADKAISEVLSAVNKELSGKYIHAEFVGLMLAQLKRRGSSTTYETNIPLCNLHIYDKKEDAKTDLNEDLSVLFNALRS